MQFILSLSFPFLIKKPTFIAARKERISQLSSRSVKRVPAVPSFIETNFNIGRPTGHFGEGQRSNLCPHAQRSQYRIVDLLGCQVCGVTCHFVC